MTKRHKKKPARSPAATVQCPICKRKQTAGSADAIYYCTTCRVQFDHEPDEGGDYSSRNPAARLEREERRTQRGAR